jgi:voltage-gated potassium channel
VEAHARDAELSRVVPGAGRRSAARAVVRSLLTVVALVAVYYLLPLNRHFGAGTVIALAATLVCLTVLVTLQVRSIVRSRYPALRAVESLALTIPLFLLIFAVVYELLSTSDPHAFSEQLTRTDSLYFVVTVFATVGFGDITAVSEVARVLVTVQMVSDLLLIGLVVRAVLGAVQRSSRGRARADG